MATEESTVTKSPTLLAPWTKPAPARITHNVGLRVTNSLTRQKEDFVTMDGTNQMTWYMYVFVYFGDGVVCMVERVGGELNLFVESERESSRLP